MIVTENITINGKKLIRTYSDSGYLANENSILMKKSSNACEEPM